MASTALNLAGCSFRRLLDEAAITGRQQFLPAAVFVG